MPAAEYPDARRDLQTDDYFGQKVADPYRWMEAIDSPETQAWIAAEREHTDAVLGRSPIRVAIRNRLRQLWDFPRFGLPVKRGGRMFYAETSGLQNQPVLYVRDLAGGAARVLIDPNLLSTDGTVAVTTVSPSPDGTLMGYGVATAGSDWNEFRVREVAGGQDRPDVIHWVKFSSLSWTKDGRGFFYERYPETQPGDKLFGRLTGRRMCYHRLGTDQSHDPLIFELKDHPDWHFTALVTDDGQYLVLQVSKAGVVQTSIRYANLGDPLHPRIDAPIVSLLDQFDAEYSFVGSQGSVFYIRSSRETPRGSVVAIDTAHPDAGWRLAVPEGPDSIASVIMAGGKLVVSTLHEVKSRLTAFGLDGTGAQEIALPGEGAVEGVAGRSDDPELFYSYATFLTPPSVFSCDLTSGVPKVFQKPRTPFDRSAFETRQVFCRSRDGTRIPLYITGRKDRKQDGSAPAWLYGYGGFDISVLPEYAPARAVWLELGGLYVQATLRGGGEFGEAWHLAGTKERKQNVFDDFIAAADFLVSQNYTRRDRLVIEGRSNGGLLIGAVLNQRPDLCAVGFPAVGVMDMLRYHTFTIGAGWASDYGTSADPAGFGYLRAYSPVHNVRPGIRYPAVFITTGDHDDRVFPAHSFKYAAAMQYEAEQVRGSGPVLIRIESNAGHGGSSGTSPASKTIEEWADKLAFAAQHLPAGILAVPPNG